ncbi:efflux RND transporter permease subunit [Bosea sp. 2RAB26]|uniref:efflux RND transporter permease subunit n=1 Tax=Bosea sp. 2RAB26 TaxID=3237476 RepID=UPI003F923E9D
MNVSAPFIVRPIATALVMIGLTLVGLVAYFALPIAGVPQVDVPTIQITSQLPGANAETMATSVAAPLEQQLALISGVTSISSSSSLGRTAIQIEFNLNRNIDGAALDVQTAINAAGGQLPRNLPNPPTYEKVNPADAQLMSIAVTSDDLPISKVDDFVENYLALQISRITGVGLVDFHGQQKPAVRVQVDPMAISALGLSLEEVRTALSTATVNAPKGTLDGPRQSLTLDATDQLFAASSFESVIIAYRNGAPIRVGDIGKAVDGVEDIRQAAWLGDKRAVIIDVHKQPGYNINQTVQLVKDALPGLQRNLPPSVKVQVLGDRTQTIRASVFDVQITMALSIGLVVLVVFLFLRRVRATLIPSITIPVSLLASCAVMYVLGYTIDNVSLMALTIAVGFIIDDAVVMVENIVRHVEAGERPIEAALKGSQEVGFTIVSMTLSLVSVFIPLLLMSGLIGRLFREFAVTLSVAILVSGLVSLTLTPMMCGQLLQPVDHGRKQGWLAAALEDAFEFSLRGYGASLRFALRHRLVIMALFATTLVGTAYLYVIIPKGFFPQQDNGTIQGSTEAAQDISYMAMVEHQHRVAKVVTNDPDVQTVYTWVGANPTVNSGRVMIDLKPFSQRKASATEVIARLRKVTLKVPGILLFGQARQDVQIGARISKTQYQYTLQDPDVAELFHWAPVVLKKLSELPQLQDVTGDLQASAPRMTLKIDRDALGRLGVTPQAVDDTLYDAFGQRQVATIFGQLDQHHVILELEPRFQEDVSALDRLYVRSTITGRMVPLSVLVSYETSVAPLTINHQDQFPSVTLSFNLAAGHSLGEALDAISNMERTMAKPARLTARYQGSAKVFESSLANQPYLILAAVVAVYIVLGVLYESFVHPITILSTLPSAGVGAFLALLALGYEFSLIAMIGVILLVGIVKKNAIMMIDFALARARTHEVSPEESIYEACLLRFRPIMMTTMAALLGSLPLALGIGAGSELRRPLGIAIVGGLMLSQLLTLYTTPIIYIYLNKLTGRAKKDLSPVEENAVLPRIPRAAE